MIFSRNEAELKEKRSEYNKNFNQYGPSIKALKWHSYRAAATRYRNLIADIDFHNKSILDVGCGFGDIIPYIYSQTDCFQYTGVDMVNNFVREAQKRYPDFRFIQKDYFQEPLKENFDIVLCCGALNSKFSHPLEYRQDAIKKIFSHCKMATAFNMAGGISVANPPEFKKIWYANSLTVLTFCLTLSKKVIFKQHYREKDFSIILFR